MSNNLFRIFVLALIPAAMVLATPAAAQSTDRPATEASFYRLLESISPSEGEQKWRRTPWIPSIWGGIQLAQERQQPIFLWAMNGDPLGCV